jgi:hypothetical protein
MVRRSQPLSAFAGKAAEGEELEGVEAALDAVPQFADKQEPLTVNRA